MSRLDDIERRLEQDVVADISGSRQHEMAADIRGVLVTDAKTETAQCPECGTLCTVERHKLHIHYTPVNTAKATLRVVEAARELVGFEPRPDGVIESNEERQDRLEMALEEALAALDALTEPSE